MLYIRLKHKTKVLKDLVRLGVVAPTWLRDIEIFEEFHAWTELPKMVRYELLAEKYGIGDKQVRSIIDKMSK